MPWARRTDGSVTALATSSPEGGGPVKASPYWSTNRVPPGRENTQSGGYWSPGSSTTSRPAEVAAPIRWRIEAR